MLKQYATLWYLGLRESLQVHRCVVFLVLDGSRALRREVLHCLLLNGGILLGSILLWERALLPAVLWLLRVAVAPCLGPLAQRAAGAALQLAFQGLWLLPVYLVTMLLSCGMYNDIARIAYQIKQQQQHLHQQQQRQQQAASGGQPAAGGRPMGQGGPTAGGGGSSSSTGGLGDIAQEVYRVVLFCVFFAEVSAVGRLPYVGPLLNVLCLSWLYAYYCFDYKWGLQRAPLTERLAYFESRWAFFAGFGLPMALSTVLLSFFQGAAVLAVLFPVYILVACDSDVNAVHDRVLGPSGSARLPHLPIFALALWPTRHIVVLVTGGAGGPSAAAASAASAPLLAPPGRQAMTRGS